MRAIDLIKIEYKKFSKNVVIRMLLIFFTIATPFIVFIGKRASVPDEFPIKPTVFFEFPTVWDYQGYIAQWMVFIFLGFLGVMIVSIEIRNKTMRQSLIQGMTRSEFYLSKVLSVAAISLYATMVYWISSFIIGIINTPEFSFGIALDNEWAGMRFFLMSFCYLSFAMILTFWVKNAGLAIFMYIAYILFEPALRWALFFNPYSDFLHNQSVKFYPFNAVEDLMPFPMFSFADAIPFDEKLDFNFLLTFPQAAITCIIFFGVFYFFSYRSFLKKDL